MVVGTELRTLQMVGKPLSTEPHPLFLTSSDTTELIILVLLLNFIIIIIIVYAYMCTYVHVWVWMSQNLWRPEDSFLEWVLSKHLNMDSMDPTQVSRLLWQVPSALSNLTSLHRHSIYKYFLP